MKRFAMILSLLLVVSLLAGCTGTTVVYTDCTCSGNHGNVQDGSQDNAVITEGSVKTGLAILTAINIKTEESKASYDVTLAAVLVDDNGVIVDCVIDSVAADVLFDATGGILTEDAAVQTKYELGDAYGMVAYSGGKAVAEWYVQADALADYAVGKTVEELKAGAVNETGHAQDADLATSATIRLDGYVAAIEAAVNNAQHLGAQGGDELKLASINNLVGGGLNTDVVALTLRDGVITSCCLDSLQASLNVAEDGTVSAGNTLSKNALGFDYGMVDYTGGAAIGEWFEQAANFCAYVTGKTPAQVADIAVNADNKPEDADLQTSVTIKIDGFQALIAKAAA